MVGRDPQRITYALSWTELNRNRQTVQRIFVGTSTIFCS